MAGASKAIKLPKLVTYKKQLALHANVFPLVPKLGELKLLFNFFVDMLCITETWLNSGVTDAEVSLENYNIFRENR